MDVFKEFEIFTCIQQLKNTPTDQRYPNLFLIRTEHQLQSHYKKTHTFFVCNYNRSGVLYEYFQMNGIFCLCKF